MKFEKLILSNFACYHQEHTIDLTCSADKPVVIILGGTGFGKTSLFDAINWALYGKVYEADLPKLRRGREIADYVNETALWLAKKDNHRTVEMTSTLYFEHERRHYYITQYLSAQPVATDSGGIQAKPTHSQTTLHEILQTGKRKKKQDHSLFLNEILPSNVRDYFLFDGDRIYNLTTPESSQEVQDAIYRVVDLELLQNAETHLSQIALKYQRKGKKEAHGELLKVEEAYASNLQKLVGQKETLGTLRQQKQSLNSQLNVIDDRLANTADTRELQGRRSELEKEEIKTRQEISALQTTIRELASVAALKLAHQSTQTLIAELDSKRNKGEIPKAVSQTLLKDLIKMQRCLCGTEFTKQDPIYETLMARLQTEKDKPNDQALLNLLMRIQNASTRIETSHEQLAKERTRLQQLQESLQDTIKAIEQIDADLAKFPQADVAELTQQARQLRIELVDNEGKIQRAMTHIEETEKQLKEQEKQRQELSKQQVKIRAIQLRERIAREAIREIEDIYDVFAENSRKAVEQLTIKEFQQFVQSSSGYKVGLTENYQLQVYDSNGNPALQRLSMGQSQCLSLAFITAISRVSEKNPPLVIDMPFGRLDTEVHHDISHRLPQITSQLILFLIPDVEYNEVTRANLSQQISHVYQLGFDKSLRQTKIDKLT